MVNNQRVQITQGLALRTVVFASADSRPSARCYIFHESFCFAGAVAVLEHQTYGPRGFLGNHIYGGAYCHQVTLEPQLSCPMQPIIPGVRISDKRPNIHAEICIGRWFVSSWIALKFLELVSQIFPTTTRKCCDMNGSDGMLQHI
eukprot:807974-Amphidinium_carterae.2